MSDDVAKDDLRFRDREALEEWLQTQSREVCLVLAVRAALRVLPLAARAVRESGYETHTRQYKEIISLLFRIVSVVRAQTKYQDIYTELSPTILPIISAVHAIIAKFMGQGEVVVLAVNSASNAIVAAQSPQFAPFASHAVDSASRAIAFAAGDHNSEAIVQGSQINIEGTDYAWSAFSNDAAFVADDGTVFQLADRPLWPDGTPRWASDSWAKLASTQSPGEDWEVWTRWYAERLKGASSGGEAYELVFARVPEEVWKEGPSAANRWIKEHLPKDPSSAVKPLENIPSPFTFGFRRRRKIIESI